MTTTRRKGFTLIELLVVIVLAAILFPVFVRAQEKARQVTIVADEQGLALVGEEIDCRLDITGRITVKAEDLTYTLDGLRARKDRSEIVSPLRMLSAQVVADKPEYKVGRAVFLFPDNVHLVVRLEVRSGVPAVLFYSHMENLGKDELDRDKWAWYDWHWAYGHDEFVTGEGPELVTRFTHMGGFLTFEDWLFIKAHKGGGLGILTRMPVSSDQSTAFIWSTNRTLHCALIPARSPEQVRKVFAQMGGITVLPEVPAIAFRWRPQEYFGTPAPQWLREAEICNFLYENWADKDEWLNSAYFPLLLFASRIQWPMGEAPSDFVQRAHERGIKVIPYVSWYELSDLSKAKDRGYYNALMDIEHHLDDWVCLDAKGDYVVSPFGRMTDQPHLYAMCMKAEGFHNRVLEVVSVLMDSGIDGLFIDNVGGADPCHGETLGRHKHLDPAASPDEMFQRLLAKVYQLVKSYGDDKVVMHNGRIDWRTCDSQMTEGFLYYGLPVRIRLSANELHQRALEWEEVRQRGKVITLLSYTYVLPSAPRKDADFYAYAAAKLAGTLWTNWFNPSIHNDKAVSTALYRLRLEMPRGKIVRQGDVLYRVYENGAVVVNTGRAEVKVVLPVPLPSLFDLYNGQTLQPKDGRFMITVPGNCGRVYSGSR